MTVKLNAKHPDIEQAAAHPRGLPDGRRSAAR